jgi:hypothetical protein
MKILMQMNQFKRLVEDEKIDEVEEFLSSDISKEVIEKPKDRATFKKLHPDIE